MEINSQTKILIREQIEALEHQNAEMLNQMQREINKNSLLIYALKQLLENNEDLTRE